MDKKEKLIEAEVFERKSHALSVFVIIVGIILIGLIWVISLVF